MPEQKQERGEIMHSILQLFNVLAIYDTRSCSHGALSRMRPPTVQKDLIGIFCFSVFIKFAKMYLKIYRSWLYLFVYSGDVGPLYS